MKALLILTLVFCFSLEVNSQDKVTLEASSVINDSVLVYRTCQDYKTGKAENYDKFKHLHKNTLAFIKGSETIKIDCKEIWGFFIHAQLFRIDIYDDPQLLLSMGLICYYERGEAYLKMIETGNTSC